MTVKEFYDNIHGDYNDIISRFSSDELVLYFVKQFPSDSSYMELTEAVKDNNIEASFAAAHKMKGIAANLSFYELYEMLSELSEQLRPKTRPADTSLVRKIGESYSIILQEINRLVNGQCV